MCCTRRTYRRVSILYYGGGVHASSVDDAAGEESVAEESVRSSTVIGPALPCWLGGQRRARRRGPHTRPPRRSRGPATARPTARPTARYPLAVRACARPAAASVGRAGHAMPPAHSREKRGGRAIGHTPVGKGVRWLRGAGGAGGRGRRGGAGGAVWLASVDVLLEPLAGEVVDLSRDVVLEGGGARVHGDEEEEEEEHVEDGELNALPYVDGGGQLALARELSLGPIEAGVAEAPAHVAGDEEEGKHEGDEVIPLRVEHLGERHRGHAVEQHDREEVYRKSPKEDDHVGAQHREQ
mmetsp:Transcript_13898/g.36491  ORF Transcript_13898/g.36491 Transcript_13898/m.36491 type:complete len:296 (+) Transcript_13898:9-896(+)